MRVSLARRGVIRGATCCSACASGWCPEVSCFSVLSGLVFPPQPRHGRLMRAARGSDPPQRKHRYRGPAIPNRRLNGDPRRPHTGCGQPFRLGMSSDLRPRPASGPGLGSGYPRLVPRRGSRWFRGHDEPGNRRACVRTDPRWRGGLGRCQFLQPEPRSPKTDAAASIERIVAPRRNAAASARSPTSASPDTRASPDRKSQPEECPRNRGFFPEGCLHRKSRKRVRQPGTAGFEAATRANRIGERSRLQPIGARASPGGVAGADGHCGLLRGNRGRGTRAWAQLHSAGERALRSRDSEAASGTTQHTEFARYPYPIGFSARAGRSRRVRSAGSGSTNALSFLLK